MTARRSRPRLQSTRFVPVAAAAEEGAQSRKLHSQQCFVIDTPQVELAVTELGGHMTAVFYRDSGKRVAPYYISPWQDEPSSQMPAPVLIPLRGDFFCLPF